MSPAAAEQEAGRICREPGPDHAALLAVLDGEVVGCGTYERAAPGTGPRRSPSRSPMTCITAASACCCWSTWSRWPAAGGSATLTAETLYENAAMLRVFADAGLQAQRSLVDGVYELTFPLPADEADAALGTYRDTVAVRERSADVASMRHVLVPASVAVIGAGRRPGSVGRAILHNIVTGGFSGAVYPVNPRAAELDGISCVPSAAALPEPVDLAVIAVPAAAVLGIAEECGRRGVRALVVIAAGLGGAARAELLEHLPPPRHADGRAGQLRRGQPRHRPGRDVRGPPSPAGRPAWPCSPPAASASCCLSTCPGWAWGSPPWSPSATRMTCPAPTCCSGGRPTRRPSWPCCTWNRSGTRLSSPVPPAASAAPCRS